MRSPQREDKKKRKQEQSLGEHIQLENGEERGARERQRSRGQSKKGNIRMSTMKAKGDLALRRLESAMPCGRRIMKNEKSPGCWILVTEGSGLE